MAPRRTPGYRPEVESDVGHEPNPRDIETQNLRHQVERLIQRPERLERPNHHEDFNDELDAEEFISPFHSRSTVRTRWHMESYEDELEKALYDGDEDPIYDDKSHDDKDDEFYGNSGQSLTSEEVDWSKPPVFDDCSEDVHVDDMMIIDVNQDSDFIDHPILMNVKTLILRRCRSFVCILVTEAWMSAISQWLTTMVLNQALTSKST